VQLLDAGGVREESAGCHPNGQWTPIRWEPAPRAITGLTRQFAQPVQVSSGCFLYMGRFATRRTGALLRRWRVVPPRLLTLISAGWPLRESLMASSDDPSGMVGDEPTDGQAGGACCSHTGLAASSWWGSCPWRCWRRCWRNACVATDAAALTVRCCGPRGIVIQYQGCHVSKLPLCYQLLRDQPVLTGRSRQVRAPARDLSATPSAPTSQRSKSLYVPSGSLASLRPESGFGRVLQRASRLHRVRSHGRF